MIECLMFGIGILTFLVSSWVLYIAWQAKELSRMQIKLTTDPDFQLSVSKPYRDGGPRINCRNKGMPVTHFEVTTDGKQLNVTVESGDSQGYRSYNIDLPLSFIDDNETLCLKVTYQDKLKRSRKTYFLYDVKNSVIKPKS